MTIKIRPLSKGLLYLFIALTVSIVSAQNHDIAEITGRITDSKGKIIPLVNISLKGTPYGTVSDENGHFKLQVNKPGRYQLVMSCLGYQTKYLEADLNKAKRLTFNELLFESNTTIDEIMVTGKSEATILREKSYAIEVIESKQFKNLSTNGNDILGKLSGVNIRQSGGLGSNYTLSLNGLSNNQIRIFIDGIPMDYFGSSLSLNNFSANLIERIEVYKGVVPIHLSADALGGAINVVTLKKKESFLDASYSIGSFGTHVASVNSQYRDTSSGYTLQLMSFYNKADNNYKVPIYLVDFTTGKESEQATWVERFHDAYESKMFWLQTGFTQTRWADNLMFGLMYSDNYNEIQQPTHAVGQAKIPYGEVSTTEDKWIVNAQYENNNIWKHKLGLRSYFVGVFSDNINSDTSSYRYDWFANKTFFHENVGEIENRKTLLTLDVTNILGNTYLEYQLNKKHGLAANISLNYLNLKGSDQLKNQNNTQFKDPSTVIKNATGLSYTNRFFNDILRSSLFIKWYNYKLESIETDYQGNESIPVNIDKDFVGYGFSGTLHRGKFQFKSSYEYATRFPELFELFGDGLNNVANPSLQPERSHNYNVGIIFSQKHPNGHSILSFNAFIRDASDFIRQEVTGIKARHINDASTLSKGIDISGVYHYKKALKITLNGTYVDIRNNSGNNKTNFHNARKPNEPYLFGNLQFTYQFEEVFSKADRFSMTASQYYVHSFPYRWEYLASKDKEEVPTQYSTDLDFVYSLKNGRYNISAGIINLLDQDRYDNFEQRRPGRTLSFKMRYFIHSFK